MTTTDPFTEAARAYAEQACYQDENIPIAEAGFRAGWKAARAYLATQEESVADDLRAEGWDEGQVAGWDDARDEWLSSGVVNDLRQWSDTPNPYRTAAATEGER